MLFFSPIMANKLKPALTSYFTFLFVICFAALSSQGGVVITGTLGEDTQNQFKNGHFGYSAALYSKFDDMTLVGVRSGQSTVASSTAIPVFASAIERLPIGRIVLPVVAVDLGYAFDDNNSGLIWSGGGGLDIRNGRHSSFLVLAQYQGQSSTTGWSLRGGILLEF